MRDYYINNIEWNSFVTRTYVSYISRWRFSCGSRRRVVSFFVGDNAFIFSRQRRTHYQIVTLVAGTTTCNTAACEWWLRYVADVNNDGWNCIREKKTKRVTVQQILPDAEKKTTNGEE